MADRLTVGRLVLVQKIGVRFPVRQRACETDRGLFINVFQGSKMRTSHGLELTSKIR